MTEAAYELKSVARIRGAAFRLQVDSLSIPTGKTLALLGPTGSGKTTLLRLLTGLDRCDAGAVLFRGRPIGPASSPAVLQQIAMVPQKPLMLRGTVRWNLGYGLRARGQAIGERVEAIAKQLGLLDLLGRDARRLSGGQTQLVALGRALAVEPQVLLLDEPTANLDPAYVAKVEQAVTELGRREMTVVWSTHNLFQAKRVSQQTALLLDGGFVEVATTEQFFSAPCDPRSRAFVSGEIIC